VLSSERHQDQERKAAFYFSITKEPRQPLLLLPPPPPPPFTTTTHYPFYQSTDKALSKSRRVLQQQRQSIQSIKINHQLSSSSQARKSKRSKSKAKIAGLCRRFPSSIVCSIFSSITASLEKHHHWSRSSRRTKRKKGNSSIVKQKERKNNALSIRPEVQHAVSSRQVLTFAHEFVDNSSWLSSRRLRPDNLRPSKFSSGASRLYWRFLTRFEVRSNARRALMCVARVRSSLARAGR
jgi:hypothetical protein